MADTCTQTPHISAPTERKAHFGKTVEARVADGLRWV
jgi:hypothetical protein